MSNSRLALLALLALLAASLVACGGGGGSHHNKPPAAKLTLSPSSGAAPLTVTGSADGSSDADGTIAQYAWEFGDGSTATGVHVQHTYAAVGEFVVKLTVTDDRGTTATASTSVTATGSLAVYNASLFDTAAYQDEPSSGTLDSTPLQ